MGAVSAVVSAAFSASAAPISARVSVSGAVVVGGGVSVVVGCGLTRGAAGVAVFSVRSITSVSARVVVVDTAILIEDHFMTESSSPVADLFDQPLEGWGLFVPSQSAEVVVVHMRYFPRDDPGDDVKFVERDMATVGHRFIPLFLQTR